LVREGIDDVVNRVATPAGLPGLESDHQFQDVRRPSVRRSGSPEAGGPDTRTAQTTQGEGGPFEIIAVAVDGALLEGRPEAGVHAIGRVVRARPPTGGTTSTGREQRGEEAQIAGAIDEAHGDLGSSGIETVSMPAGKCTEIYQYPLKKSERIAYNLLVAKKQ
jgi:hypothetical protein